MGKCLSCRETRPRYHQDAYSDITSLLWTRHHATLYSKLSRNIIRVIGEYFRSEARLIDLQTTYLRIFSLRTNSWHRTKKLRREIKVDAFSSSWVWLDTSRVFVCGGAPCKD